ncbi:hypothetical protein ES703_108506 [subsurface metagenome]
MAARMRHRCLPAVPGGLDAGSIGQTSLFFHRQRVELGAHHHRRPVAVPVDGDETGAADLLGDLETQRTHLGGEFGGGLDLLER